MRMAALLSAEEFARVADVLGPCELVRGEIVFMSPAGIRHSRVNARAVWLLQRYCEGRDIGTVLAGEAGVIVARRPDTVRGADVAFISYQRLPREAAEDGFLRQPPELVIEVLGNDRSWKEMEEKITDYHAFGVDLVWVLDPQTLTLRAYTRGDDQPRLLRDDDLASADPHVPGFAVTVSDFFAS